MDATPKRPVEPRTRYGPEPLVDLGSRATRERLSPSALRAFLNVMDRWDVKDEDARELLGGVSNGTLHAIKRREKKLLNADELLRVSYLVGIFKALNILYSTALADAWMRRPNSNSIFGGEPPLEYVRRGGIPALQTVRRLLDSRRGGL
ncbi:MAG TPA: MbcA/ParS/Xre antitoxin family protein [Thermoanaerobaculia bacterium]|jgi:hypothetical protein|nr:MbcA/ParS/Xre antitoxin family protein [Thermoanaerobaculia bacterium]